MVTVTVLELVPVWPRMFMVIGIRPLACAGTFQGIGGNSAVVQPQEASHGGNNDFLGGDICEIKGEMGLPLPSLA